MSDCLVRPPSAALLLQKLTALALGPVRIDMRPSEQHNEEQSKKRRRLTTHQSVKDEPKSVTTTFHLDAIQCSVVGKLSLFACFVLQCSFVC